MLNFEDHELFVNAPVACSVLNLDGTQVAANARFWELFRCSPGTLTSATAMTQGEFVDSTTSYLGELASGERDRVEVKKRYVRPDGTEFWGRLTATRILAVDGSGLLFGVIEDIDEQFALESQLRSMAADQTEFVARVSHEIRNPLHTIAGLAELLSSSEIDAQARRQASIILREANALTAIVSDLLDIGKFDSGNLAIENASFELRSMIERSVRAARSPAEKKGMQVNVYIDDGLPIYVLGDAGRLGQVVDNLCGNAIKFTTAGSVTLDVRSGSEDNILFRVIDTGAGIPDDRQAEIFEPFQRLNASAPGAGLGLAISSRLAQSMGGSLGLASSTSEGSTFILDVPLPQVEAPPTASAPAAQPTAVGTTKARVLVVEDNPETQMLASAQLTRLGYDHEMVGDGYSALDLTETEAFDAILMDWHLPGIDGLETTRRIRQREEREGRPRTPIISVTARAMAADIEACKEAGADDFIAKPASIAKVGEVLQQWTAGAVAEQQASSGAVDSTVFANLMEELGDPDLVLMIARTFLDELPRRVAAIADPAAESESIELAAHTLKSTSAMLGAYSLRDMAADLEKSARNGERVDEAKRNELHDVANGTESAVLELVERLENA